MRIAYALDLEILRSQGVSTESEIDTCRRGLEQRLRLIYGAAVITLFRDRSHGGRSVIVRCERNEPSALADVVEAAVGSIACAVLEENVHPPGGADEELRREVLWCAERWARCRELEAEHALSARFVLQLIAKLRMRRESAHWPQLAASLVSLIPMAAWQLTIPGEELRSFIIATLGSAPPHPVAS